MNQISREKKEELLKQIRELEKKVEEIEVEKEEFYHQDPAGHSFTEKRSGKKLRVEGPRGAGRSYLYISTGDSSRSSGVRVKHASRLARPEALKLYKVLKEILEGW